MSAAAWLSTSLTIAAKSPRGSGAVVCVVLDPHRSGNAPSLRWGKMHFGRATRYTVMMSFSARV